jgi:hypothetical protein
MNLDQLAKTIDQQRSEADQRFRNHAVEVETNLTGQAETQNTRVTRRRASASPARQDSPDSLNSDLRKTQRTAEWASSLESEQLQNITEEESELIDDENTRHGTDPSSFPSGIDEHSYNYERGLRRPRILDNRANFASTFFSELRDVALQLAEDVATFSRRTAGTVYQASRTSARAIFQSLPYVGLAILVLLTATLFAIYTSNLFCTVYRHSFCDPLSTSALQARLQSYCGECITSSYTLPDDLTPEQQTDVSGISRAVASLRRQLEDVEKRINSKLDAKYSIFSVSVEELKERQRDIETHLSKLERQSTSSSGKSSFENRVNYFAPGSGAIINPIKSSPTLQRPPNIFWKSWQLITGRVNYVSNPPAVALEAWADLGDCWCAAGGQDIRLDVKMAYLVYPTDITIEHIATSASPDPGTAPREVEVWASFAHLSAEDFAEKGIWNMVGSNPIAAGMGTIGSFVYDARPGADPVQTFRLDVNQGTMIHSTSEVTVRVMSNQGADRTCLYRVKLYGNPVIPHPQPVGLDGL